MPENKNIWMQEEYINVSAGYRVGDSGVFESRFTTKQEVYKYCLSEFGKCTGKVYIGEGTPIGWVFQKRVKYEDSKETYLQDVWVTLYSAPPVKSIQYNYLEAVTL